MAFMMPVVKNQYNIYPCRSRNSSTCSIDGTRSRKVSESAKSTPDVLSTSPQSTASVTPHHVRYARSHSQDSNGSDSSSSSSSSSAVIPSPKSGSISSLQKFHNRLVEKLRRKFKTKVDDDDGAALEEVENDAKARSSS